MAKVNISEKEAAREESIQQTVSKTEKFFNENGKTLWICLGAVVIIGLGILGYQKFIYQPKCAEAMQQTFPAERSFMKGEYELALNGDGNVLGFSQIIDEYGTKAGKAVYMYAGICQLQLGKYEEAIAYLQKYDGKDAILSAKALACEGDANVGLEKYDAAIACYKKAIAVSDNVFAASYLFKEGLAYQKIGDKASAVECFKTIKDKYPQSVEAFDIDKYISSVAE